MKSKILYIKLFNKSDPIPKTPKTKKEEYIEEERIANEKKEEFVTNIILPYPIQGAKYIKVCNIFANSNNIFLVKCDLLETENLYTNIIDSNKYKRSSFFENQILFLGSSLDITSYEGEILKIVENRSFIDEFTITVKNLKDIKFNSVEIADAFIVLKIYYE